MRIAKKVRILGKDRESADNPAIVPPQQGSITASDGALIEIRDSSRKATASCMNCLLQLFTGWSESMEVRQYSWGNESTPTVKRHRVNKYKDGEALGPDSRLRLGRLNLVVTALAGKGKPLIDEERLALERRLWRAKQALLTADQRKEYPPDIPPLPPPLPIPSCDYCAFTQGLTSDPDHWFMDHVCDPVPYAYILAGVF